MSKVWLVTGSARGLGRDIVEAALAAGERVVATARDPRMLQELIGRYGDQVRAIALDVTDAAASIDAVQATLDAFGRVDVVVNNAGFGHLAPFEQTTADDFRAQIDTNFFGVVNMTRAVLPVMRKQRAGHIFQVSSVGGRVGMSGFAAYQAAKFAVGGFTEVVSQEVAPFGVKIVSLEPGSMKTGWIDEAGRAIPQLLADYEASVGKIIDLLGQYDGKEVSNPAKVAALIVRLAYHDALPPHLLLGSDALHFSSEGDKSRAAHAAQWHNISQSTDYAATGPVPPLPGV
jgi:NAD(P)-dependent dehydrogenase (short-subunit alcohol dehydrogenase family)